MENAEKTRFWLIPFYADENDSLLKAPRGKVTEVTTGCWEDVMLTVRHLLRLDGSLAGVRICVKDDLSELCRSMRGFPSPLFRSIVFPSFYFPYSYYYGISRESAFVG